MLTLLIILFLVGLLILVVTIKQPFLQLNGYLIVSLFFVLLVIGLNIFHFTTAIAILVLMLVLIIWLLLGLVGLIRRTPQLLAKLNFKFKLALFIATVWFIIASFFIFLILFNLVNFTAVFLWLIFIPVYFILALLAYYVNSFLLTRSFKSPITNQILLILGAGLFDGKHPGSELKRRLNKAIQLSQLADRVAIIVSGGQGLDEQRSEASAMKEYLIEHQVMAQKITIEDQSKNTWKNLVNSQQIILHHFDDKRSIAVISNQYHLLRVCLYAQKLHFKVEPIGVTSDYQLYPSASIRELISILLLHPYRHCLMAIILAIIISLV
ncbi:membrane protein [Paucilactobacillus hokkaidonensis JCM 18461]|uniref:Membrane protein n=2 Tax=Paucilactobacillus hokkaidonensis TaxID=1193095 RepID=A0A0A1GZQ5_9LACO|nr:YdcF family protein [Paucilactobacillus hokkaidonensis]BAP86479.1 membrane protein [Paucilactobacillus hokkaidonensis JCM 18461]